MTRLDFPYLFIPEAGGIARVSCSCAAMIPFLFVLLLMYMFSEMLELGRDTDGLLHESNESKIVV